MLVAAMVVVGAIATVVLVARDGGDGKEKKGPIESSSGEPEPTPSLSLPSGLPGELPTSFPTDLPSTVPSLPTDFPSDLDSLTPAPAAGEVPYYRLKTGDCFNVNTGKPGRAATKSCRTPHDAEVVGIVRLKGSYTTNAELKKAAAGLCRQPLERKARNQPSGTVRGTLVQYPDVSGYRIGIDDVACSLAGDAGAGKHKLTKPLS
ncbi:hypothetical protein [Streptomyces alfalfae]